MLWKDFADIQQIFEAKKVETISSADLIEALCVDKERPWVNFNKGFSVKPVQIAKYLKSFGISPKQKKIDGVNINRYEKFSFEETWNRYLHNPGGSVLSSTPLPLASSEHSSDFFISTLRPKVEDKKELKQASIAEGRGVEAKKGVAEDMHTTSQKRITVYV